MRRRRVWMRTAPGLYRYGDWTIGRTEGDQRSFGYEWCAEHPDHGEFFNRTLADAKETAELQMDQGRS